MSVYIRENKGIGIVPRLNDAMAIYIDRKHGGYVLIGKPLIDRLSESTLTGLFAHELAHLKRSHSAQIFILILLIGMVGLPPYFIFFSFATYHIAIITVTSFMALALSRLSWYHEYEADLIASQYVGQSMMISTLQQLEIVINRPRDTFTHPSYAKRIERLRVSKRVKYSGKTYFEYG
jgi:Zn-dependent protease with chaperone function